jgi:hypothetical protein
VPTSALADQPQEHVGGTDSLALPMHSISAFYRHTISRGREDPEWRVALLSDRHREPDPARHLEENLAISRIELDAPTIAQLVSAFADRDQ